MSSQKRRDKNKGQLESQIWILWNKLHHSAAPSRSCVFVCFKSKKERTGQRDQRMRLLIIVSPCRSTRSMRRRRTRKENRRADLIEWERKKPVSAKGPGTNKHSKQIKRWEGKTYLFHAITATTLTLRTATTVLVLPLLLMDVCQLAIH